MLSLAEFDNGGNRLLYGPANNSVVPNLFRSSLEADNTDDDMPAALCGWCGGCACNGLNLNFCMTWCRVRAELTLQTPRHLHGLQ